MIANEITIIFKGPDMQNMKQFIYHMFKSNLHNKMHIWFYLIFRKTIWCFPWRNISTAVSLSALVFKPYSSQWFTNKSLLVLRCKMTTNEYPKKISNFSMLAVPSSKVNTLTCHIQSSAQSHTPNSIISTTFFCIAW